jgi:hypothetical protein
MDYDVIVIGGGKKWGQIYLFCCFGAENRSVPLHDPNAAPEEIDLSPLRLYGQEIDLSPLRSVKGSQAFRLRAKTIPYQESPRTLAA